MSFQAMAWATRQSSGLSTSSKFVLLMLANRAGDDFSCYPSIGCISDDTLLTKRSVIEQIKTLENLGYVTVDRNHRHSNRYILKVSEKPSERRSPGKLEVVNPSYLVNEVQGGVNDVHPASELGSPKLVNEVHPNQSVEPVSEPVIESGRAPDREKTLPHDFTMPDEWIVAVMERRDVSRSIAEIESENFLNYYTNGKGIKIKHIDWRRAWLAWCNREYALKGPSKSIQETPRRQARQVYQ